MKRIIGIYKKYKGIINYLIFGVLTTIVNLVTFFVLTNTIFNPDNSVQLQIATIIAWIVGVAFAYLTNRKYVFESNNGNIKKEVCSFVIARLATLFLEMGIMYLGVSVLKYDHMIIKIIANVIVIVSNYVFSKIFVFKKK